MRKQPTGEPVAGKLHTGFGGRGWRKPFPTPILRPKAALRADSTVDDTADPTLLMAFDRSHVQRLDNRLTVS